MASITLKNIPDDLRLKLKAQAKRNGRSLQQEILMQLRFSVAPSGRKDVDAEIQDMRAFRQRQAAAGIWVDEADVLRWTEEHRL